MANIVIKHTNHPKWIDLTYASKHRSLLLWFMYFYYFRFLPPSGTLYDDPLTVYNFTGTFSRLYNNIHMMSIIFSSFQSTVSNYFGFDIGATYTGNSATAATITLTVSTNSGFKLMGFDVIVICDSFKETFYMVYFELDLMNIDHPEPFIIPANTQVHTFIKSFIIRKQGTLTDFKITLTHTLDIPNNIIKLKYVSIPPQTIPTNNVDVKAYILVIDLDKLPTQHQFSLFQYQFDSFNDAFAATLINFGIDQVIYGKDYYQNCIFGFGNIDKFEWVNPVFDFQLNNIFGITVGRDNSPSPWAEYQFLCTKDMKCPSLFPFHLNNDVNCYDCTLKNTFIPADTIPHCTTLDDTKTMIQYDYNNGNILKKCLFCSTCETDYIRKDYLCYLCSQLTTHCDTCDPITYDCLTCVNTHYLDSSPTPPDCKLCNSVLTNCNLCSSDTNCINCISTQYYISGGNCLSCSIITDCLQCEVIIPATTPTCKKCVTGYFLYGVDDCQKCSDHITSCGQCNDAITCDVCQPYYYLNTYNIPPTCDCQNGWLVTSTYTSIYGCISSHMVNGVPTCFACNTQANFVFQEPNNCVCKKGYYFYNNICNLLCGDAIYINIQGPNGCDDGNIRNDDGCSSTCMKQNNFICNNVENYKSICRLIPDFNVEVYSLTRQYSTNKLVLKLKFNPYYSAVQYNQWQQYITILNSHNRISYDSGTFQQDSILTLKYTLLQSIQSQILRWQISFNPQKFSSGSKSLIIPMKGQYSPLFLQPYYSQQQILQIYCYIISGLSFIMGTISILKSNSNISFQLICFYLFIFYCRMLTYEYNPAIIYVLSPLRIAAGYGEFFIDQNRDYKEYVGKNRFYVKSQPMKYLMLHAVVIGFVTIISVIIRIRLFMKNIYKKQLLSISLTSSKLIQPPNTNTLQLPFFKKLQLLQKQCKKVFDKYTRLHLKYIYSLLMILTYPTLIILMGNFYTKPSYQINTTLQIIINLIIQLLLFIGAMYVLIVSGWIFVRWYNQYLNVEFKNKLLMVQFVMKQNRSYYYEMFSLYQLIQVIICVFTFNPIKQQVQFKFCIYIILVINLLYIIYLFNNKPYDNYLYNGHIIFNEFVKLLFLFYLLLLTFGIKSHFFNLLIIYFILISLTISLIISIIRIKKQWIQPDKNNKQFQKLLEKKNRMLIQDKNYQKNKKYKINDSENQFKYFKGKINIVDKQIKQREKLKQLEKQKIIKEKKQKQFRMLQNKLKQQQEEREKERKRQKQKQKQKQRQNSTNVKNNKNQQINNINNNNTKQKQKQKQIQKQKQKQKQKPQIRSKRRSSFIHLKQQQQTKQLRKLQNPFSKHLNTQYNEIKQKLLKNYMKKTQKMQMLNKLQSNQKQQSDQEEYQEWKRKNQQARINKTNYVKKRK